MNEITISKAELALDLGNAGLKVLDYVPERIVPPIVIINVASPYLTPNTISREFVMSLELVAIAATATNKQATEKLDELIADIILALPSYANLRNVLAPYNMQTNNAEYLAANIYVDIYITID
jgi:hypothetical protein